MKAFFLSLLFFVGSAAFAYKDGTYVCKNMTGLPNNVYKITTVSMGQGLPSLPLIEVDRYYFENPQDPKPTVGESHIKGLASVAAIKGDGEMLSIGSLHLEFDGDQLIGCQAP